MIYQYIAALLTLGIICLLYAQILKPFLPENITDPVSKHKYKMLGVAILLIIVSLGSPVRLESTSTTGKTSFTAPKQFVVDKAEGTKNPENQNFRTKGELFKQQKQELENEINNDEEPK